MHSKDSMREDKLRFSDDDYCFYDDYEFEIFKVERDDKGHSSKNEMYSQQTISIPRF